MFKKIKIFIIVTVLVCCALTKSNAQQTIGNNEKLSLNKLQDTLNQLSEEVAASTNNINRLEKNTQFVKKLISALKINHSFEYNFDSLKRVSILKSNDQSFRIITWHLPNDDGTYRYYGTIQMSTPDGSLKMFPLTDQTQNLSNVNAITNNKNWFGARYYEIIPIINQGKTAYWILLGWKGNDQKTSKKVIEVLSFENGEVIFGKNIFENVKGKPLLNRVIFEYNKQSSMTLLYDKKTNQIIFDHLAPFNPEMIGNYEFYAADLSFDGYKINFGKLSLLENLDLKNEPTSNDDFYGKPIKAANVTIKNN
jgi:hypothetical protein